MDRLLELVYEGVVKRETGSVDEEQEHGHTGFSTKIAAVFFGWGMIGDGLAGERERSKVALEAKQECGWR